jgi:hypothetical protein
MMRDSAGTAPSSWAGEELAIWGAKTVLRPLQMLVAAPSILFLAALIAMLLRHPDVQFYEIDRVAFGLLIVGVVVRAAVTRRVMFVAERATWPMIGLTLLALASIAGQPFDHETWSLLASKFIVPPIRIDLHDGKPLPAVRDFCADRARILELYGDCIFGGSALANFPAIHPR